MPLRTGGSGTSAPESLTGCRTASPKAPTTAAITKCPAMTLRRSPSLQRTWGIEGQPFGWSIGSCRSTTGGLHADVGLPEASTVALLDAAVHVARLADSSNPRLMFPAAVESVWFAAELADAQGLSRYVGAPATAMSSSSTSPSRHPTARHASTSAHFGTQLWSLARRRPHPRSIARQRIRRHGPRCPPQTYSANSRSGCEPSWPVNSECRQLRWVWISRSQSWGSIR